MLQCASCSRSLNFARAHDNKEVLSSKIEILKTVAKFAGIDKLNGAEVVGEKFTVTINLGGETMKIEKTLPTQVIEHDASPAIAGEVFEINAELG